MALALDGSVQAGSIGTTITLALTTANGSGNSVVGVGTNAASITSVAATGLTFGAARFSFGTAGWNILAEYTATYSVNFSGNIVVTIPSSNGTACAWGVSGSDTSTIFDSHAGIPASNGGGASTITTANANDFIYCVNSLSASTATAGTNWNALGAGNAGTNFLLCQYQIVTLTQTALADTVTTGTINASIMDAIIQASGGDTFGNSMNTLMMSRRRRDPAKILVPGHRFAPRRTRGFALAA